MPVRKAVEAHGVEHDWDEAKTTVLDVGLTQLSRYLAWEVIGDRHPVDLHDRRNER